MPAASLPGPAAWPITPVGSTRNAQRIDSTPQNEAPTSTSCELLRSSAKVMESITLMRPSSVCSTISCSFGTSRLCSIRHFPPSISKMNAGTDTPFRHSLISGRRPAGRLPVAVEAFARLGDPAGNCVELASRGEHFHQHLQGVLRFGPARIEDELHADLDQLLRRDAEVQRTLQMLHELPFHPLRRECGAGHHAAFPARDDPSRPAE